MRLIEALDVCVELACRLKKYLLDTLTGNTEPAPPRETPERDRALDPIPYRMVLSWGEDEQTRIYKTNRHRHRRAVQMAAKEMRHSPEWTDNETPSNDDEPALTQIAFEDAMEFWHTDQKVPALCPTIPEKSKPEYFLECTARLKWRALPNPASSEQVI